MKPSALRLCCLLLALLALPARAADIAIVIDDLGNSKTAGERAIALPGAVTLAFLPRTPYAATLARQALRRGKQIMLHLPMQTVDGRALGPDGLTLAMGRADIVQALHDALASLPPVAGVNNHMGSLLTQHPGDMAWLMQALARIGGLYFIDSRTSARSVALQEARRAGIPAARRHVFLDARANDPAYVRAQLERLTRLARRQGTAIAIGHPYPATLAVLEKAIPDLKNQGVRLISAGELIAERGRQAWPRSSFPSQKAAKNSKPSP